MSSVVLPVVYFSTMPGELQGYCSHLQSTDHSSCVMLGLSLRSIHSIQRAHACHRTTHTPSVFLDCLRPIYASTTPLRRDEHTPVGGCVSIRHHVCSNVLSLACRCRGFDAAGCHVAPILVNILHLHPGGGGGGFYSWVSEIDRVRQIKTYRKTRTCWV